MTLQFKVPKMACSSCASKITKAIKAIDANATVQTDSKTKFVSVKTQASQIEIQEALVAIGYSVA